VWSPSSISYSLLLKNELQEARDALVTVRETRGRPIGLEPDFLSHCLRPYRFVDYYRNGR
jgi:hypothetical protein